MVVLICDKINEKNGQFGQFDSDLNLLLMQSDYPSLFVLMGDDQSVTHAVSTIGPWLFDSNLPNAQKINQEILDWCVSSPEVKQKCVDVYWGIRLIPKPTIVSTFKQGKNKYCAHESLAIIFDLLGEQLAAAEIVMMAPTHLDNKDWFLGMVDFFQKNDFIKYTYLKRKLNAQNYCFKATDDIIVMSINDKPCALFGSWLFDATQDQPLFVDSIYFQHAKITRLFKMEVQKQMKEKQRMKYDYKLHQLFSTYPVFSYGINKK